MELRIHTETWQTTLHAEMTAEDHNSTKLAWAEADEAEDEDALATGKLKWAHLDLHDASVSAGCSGAPFLAELFQRPAPTVQRFQSRFFTTDISEPYEDPDATRDGVLQRGGHQS